MISKWYKFKKDAVRLRKKGLSLNSIKNKYGIPKSTLSYWFKNLTLNDLQKEKLLNNSSIALINARKKAILWHNKQKEKRIEEAKKQAISVLNNIDINNNILEIALSILYLGEGYKKSSQTSISSSDPLILKFFLFSIKNIYNIDIKKIKCELNLRADQDPKKIKSFWAKELNLSLNNFNYIGFDKRTIGSKSFPDYKGVCVLRCGNVAIQRRLLYLANFFCNKIIKKGL